MATGAATIRCRPWCIILAMWRTPWPCICRPGSRACGGSLVGRIARHGARQSCEPASFLKSAVGTTMRICLNLDPSRLLRWHLWVAEALAEMPGNEFSRAFATGSRSLPLVCRLLLELERLVYGFLRNSATDTVEAAPPSRVP